MLLSKQSDFNFFRELFWCTTDRINNIEIHRIVEYLHREMKKKRIRKKSENFLQLHIGHFRVLSAVIFRLSAGK